MNLSLCTISFRHQLISIDQLAEWAKANHFQGIELWGVHAHNLSEQPCYNQAWLANYGLRTTMISDYLPLMENEQALFPKVQLLCRLAKHWGAKKIRTFAGDKGSAETTTEELKTLVSHLQTICDWLQAHGLTLIVEIHPNTYADTVETTQQLFAEVNKENLKLNFDVLHVWESKADVIEALETLMPHINHFHLKNISSEEFLNVFSPPNVYAASGSRQGMVPIFDGAVDYKAFLEYLNQHPNKALTNMDTSLEWFGNQCKRTLKQDRYQIQQMEQRNIGVFKL